MKKFIGIALSLIALVLFSSSAYASPNVVHRTYEKEQFVTVDCVFANVCIAVETNSDITLTAPDCTVRYDRYKEIERYEGQSLNVPILYERQSNLYKNPIKRKQEKETCRNVNKELDKPDALKRQ